MDNIKGILVINLEKRKDRLLQFFEETDRFNINRELINVIHGLYEPRKALGCMISHIMALQKIEHITNNQDDYFMVFEDDFVFRAENTQILEEQLIDVFETLPSFDVYMLERNILKGYDRGNYIKIIEAQSAPGFIIKGSYAKKLAQHLLNGVEPLIKTGRTYLYVNDQWWKSLQIVDDWYTSKVSIGYVRESYSDNGGPISFDSFKEGFIPDLLHESIKNDNWTIITYFDSILTPDNINILTNLKTNMVIYCTEQNREQILNIRKHNIDSLYKTDCILFRWDEFNFYKTYKTKMSEDIIYKFCMFEMVSNVINDNINNSTRYGWIDPKHNYEDFNSFNLSSILELNRSKVSILYYNYINNKTLEQEILNNRHMNINNVGISFWTGNSENIKRCIELCLKKLDYFLTKNVAPTSNNCMNLVINENIDLFDLYLGTTNTIFDYKSIKTRYNNIYIILEEIYNDDRTDILLNLLKNISIDLLVDIVSHLRCTGKHNLCYFIASFALKIELNMNIYRKLKLYEDLSISSYYTPYREKGILYCDGLILSPLAKRYDTVSNCKYYLESIQTEDCKYEISETLKENYIVSSWEPFVMSKINSVSNITNITEELVNKKLTNEYSLATINNVVNPINYNSGYLCIVYHIIKEFPIKYLHRFIYFSSDFSSDFKISKPFYLNSITTLNTSLIKGDSGIIIGLQDGNVNTFKFVNDETICTYLDYSPLIIK